MSDFIFVGLAGVAIFATGIGIGAVLVTRAEAVDTRMRVTWEAMLVANRMQTAFMLARELMRRDAFDRIRDEVTKR